MSSVANMLVSAHRPDPGWEPMEDVWNTAMLIENSGYGLMTQYGAQSNINFDAYIFMEEQFRRFREPPPGEDLMEWCWNFAFYCVDQLDPYVLYQGCTDVIKTNEHLYYQFSVRTGEGDFKDISPDSLEVYRLWPKGEEVYNELMRYPGLNSYDKMLPNGKPAPGANPVGAMFFEYIYDYFDEHFTHVKHDHHPECYETELELLDKYGPRVNHLAHLGIWSCIMWMIGPEGKGWRKDHNPIFGMVYDTGAALLSDWTFYDQDYFIRHERPVKSCAICGVKDWCVELVSLRPDHKFTNLEAEAVFMCESCNCNKLSFPGRTCGAKQCSITSCKNHPSYSADIVVQRREVRMQDANNRYGELRSVNGYHLRELPGVMYVNQVMVDKYAKSIASDMGETLSRLLSPHQF